MRSLAGHAVRGVAFVVGLVGLLSVVSGLLMPKNNTWSDGMHDATTYKALCEPEDTLDVLILGDSESFCSFVPLKIWEQYGITSYCCGASAQKLNHTEEFLQEVLEKQSPKIVVLETNLIYRDVSVNDVLSRKVGRALPVFEYHNRWKSLKVRDFDFRVRYTTRDNVKGYRFKSGSNPADVSGYMKETGQAATVSVQNRYYVKRIQEHCDQVGAKLVLISAPSTKNWNTQRHNGIQKLSEDMGVEYVDMNLLKEQVPIDWEKDTFDRGDHLNYYGAEKATAFLGEYLASTGLISGHKDDQSYQHWNEALMSFKKSVADSLSGK